MAPRSGATPEEHERAKKTIEILNLNAASLVHERAAIIRRFVEIFRQQPELANAFWNKLREKDEKDRYAPFFFVVLKHFGKWKSI